MLNYNDDDYSQGYNQNKEAIRALTKDDIPNPYIGDQDFRLSNDGNNIGYNFYVFDIRYQNNFESALPNKTEINFQEIIDAGVNIYALVLTNKLISINSDGQRHFDLF